MIHRGRKVLDEATAALRRRYDTRTLLFDPLDDNADVDAVRHLPGVTELRHDDTGYAVTLASGGDAPEVMRQIAALMPVARIELARLRLDDIFIGLVSEGDAVSASLRESLRGLRAEGVTA